MTEQKPPSRGALVGAVVLALAVAALAGSVILRLAPSATEFTLAAVEADVSQRFPIVAHLSLTDLQAKLASGKPPLLLDVRDEAEYRVSHIAGAERVDPESMVADVVARFSPQSSGRDVVFYCSVGMRSSVLATEVQEQLVKAGATGVFNLRSGLFGWHNAQLPMVDAKGATDVIHPYNAQWGKLVSRQDKLRMDVAP